jgi:hypothetical protein
MMQSSITKFLTSPNHVARVLDYQRAFGAVLAMRITKNMMDLALTSHPTQDTYIQRLPSIPLQHVTIGNSNSNNKRNIKTLHPSVVKELQDIVEDWDVCGFVVHWPVQQESGRCGAPCGRVLHTLDQIASGNSKMLQNRPVCLWLDGSSCAPAVQQDDAWGRSAVYAKTPSPDKTIHYASEEQYQDDADGPVVAEIAADYMRCQWPEIMHQQHYSNNLRMTDSTCSTSPDEKHWDVATLATALGKDKKYALQQQQQRQRHGQAQQQQQFDLSWLDAYQDTAAYCAGSAF